MFATSKDRKKIYYDVFGNQNGPAIIFLNGLTQATESWYLVTPYFKEKYRIILLDFIFQGKSDKDGDWRDFDQHAADVVCVMDECRVDKAIIAGISYGSLVAQHFAVNYPDRLKGLILLSTFARKTPYYEAIELSWWRSLEQGGYQLMLDIMLPTVLSEQYFENPLIPIEVMKSARQGINQNTEAIFKLMRATKERKDFTGRLQKIKSKTLIIQGEKDLLFPVRMAEEVRQNIAGAELVIIKNAGHTLNLEHIKEVCAEMIRFSDQMK